MCCIFTCCGWMIDLVQRAWVFFMTCCIATAVCCVFLITSMSGVALGYNYSLAEYIELKETNVSVYLKRGIFDDEISDDSEWRRRGGGIPEKGFKGDDDEMISASPEEPDQMPNARRRLDDTILQSNENNKFEGSLMKLTAKAPYETTVTEAVTGDKEMLQIVNKHPPGSLEQLKAIQALINERKLKGLRDPHDKRMSTYGYDESMLAHAPNVGPNLRRMMDVDPNPYPGIPKSKDLDRFGAARKAVPDSGIGSRGNWIFPKIPASDDLKKLFTYPKPVYMNLGPIRPTQTTSSKNVPTPTSTAKEMEPTPMESGSENREDMVGDIANKFGVERPMDGDEVKPDSSGWKKSAIDYYDEDIKGLPVRKKRSIHTLKNNLAKKPHQKINFSEGDKENNPRPNEITQGFNKFVSKLLFSNNPLSSEVTVSTDIEETTKIKTAIKWR